MVHLEAPYIYDCDLKANHSLHFAFAFTWYFNLTLTVSYTVTG